MNADAFRKLGSTCAIVSFVAICAGAGGMVLSILFLASSSMNDNIAGAAGFIGGAILIAAGLTSLSVQSAVAGRIDELTSQ